MNPANYLPAPQIVPLPLGREATEFDYANLLEQEIGRLRTIGTTWFLYGGGCWNETSKHEFRPLAQNVLPPEKRTARQEAALLNSLEGRAQVKASSFKGAMSFDTDGAVLINCKNGVVRTTKDAFSILAHSEEYGFTRTVNASFSPSDKCELFTNTLEQCLPDKQDRELFQLCCGNFLYPSAQYEIALICYGEAGRGKSTIAEPIANTLGKGLMTRLSMSQICDPKSFHLPQLQYAAVNLGTELDSLQVDESGNFKTIVSGEPIAARPIYKDPFTMETTCKLWFLANSLPRFRHGTEAELRRTRFLRFDYKPEQPDVTLKARLAGQSSGVFNFMLQGLQSLLSLPAMPHGGAESREVHERFRTSNDPIGAFLREQCTFGAGFSISKETLINGFKVFCEEKNLPGELNTYFFKRIYERYPEVSQARGRDGDVRIQILKGIRLNSTL